MRSVLLVACLSVLALTGCTSVQSRIEINAPADKVREVLFEFRDYPKWNPFIVKVDGMVFEGNTIEITVQPPGKKPISGQTAVLLVKPYELIWKGSLAIPGLFSGRHEFRIEEAGPNRVVFYNNEKMSGLLLPFSHVEAVRSGFEAMNAALKQKAETPAKP